MDKQAAVPATFCTCGEPSIPLLVDCPTCEEAYPLWNCSGCKSFLRPYGNGYICPSCGEGFCGYVSLRQLINRKKKMTESEAFEHLTKIQDCYTNFTSDNPKNSAKVPEQESNSATIPFGQSLHIDLYGISKEICDDLSFCYQLLDDLTEFLNMHKQSPPFIFRSPYKEFPDKAGLSGWVPLIESGISIHTLTIKEFVSIDIYTCGDLDVEKTIKYLCNLLRTGSYEHQYLVRGKNYYG